MDLSDINKREMEAAKKQYLPIKNLEIILVDIVPYERKNKMIQGLLDLFQGAASIAGYDGPRLYEIPDMKESGVLSGGGSVNVGNIYNGDIGRFPGGVERDLPKPFSVVNVWVSQFFDFGYCVIYNCVLKDEFRNVDVENVFIQSRLFAEREEKLAGGGVIKISEPKGPKFEPSIRQYQKMMEDFLGKYSCGLFLNEATASSPVPSCPNIKIISIKEINFGSIDKWFKEHRDILEFLGVSYAISKYDDFLVSYQEETLFKKASIFQGLLFLGSETGERSIRDDICRKVEGLVLEDLVHLFQIIFGTVYWLEITCKNWEDKIKSYIVNDFHDTTAYKEAMTSYRDFQHTKIIEEENIRRLPEKIKRLPHVKSISLPIPREGLGIDLFEDMLKACDRFLEIEKERLTYLENYFQSVFEHFREMVNFNLQQNIGSLTSRLVWITVVLVILTLVMAILTGIELYTFIT